MGMKNQLDKRIDAIGAEGLPKQAQYVIARRAEGPTWQSASHGKIPFGHLCGAAGPTPRWGRLHSPPQPLSQGVCAAKRDLKASGITNVALKLFANPRRCKQ